MIKTLSSGISGESDMYIQERTENTDCPCISDTV